MSPTAIDLFCGAGGATQGLRAAGFQVLAGVEVDQAACDSYSLNHADTLLFREDIERIRPEDVIRAVHLESGALDLLKSCPPCQPYSTLSRGLDQSHGDRLVTQTICWIKAAAPKLVLLENVPGIQRSEGLKRLKTGLKRLGYTFQSAILRAEEFGIPQTRRRWFGIGVRNDISAPPPDLLAHPTATPSAEAAASIADLPKAKADCSDELHRPRRVTSLVERRIKAIPRDGSRFDLPAALQLRCHRNLGRHATGPYGRVPSQGPGPTLTTRCTTVSAGRFIHPHEDRPLTLREAAVLQTFPVTYQFSGSYGEIERQIGNAVPTRLVEIVAERLKTRLLGAACK